MAMKITITAPFGRVQVEVPQAAAVRLMLDAVRTAHLESLEDPPAWEDPATACAEEPGE